MGLLLCNCMKFIITDCCRTHVFQDIDRGEVLPLLLENRVNALLPACKNTMFVHGTAEGSKAYTIPGDQHGVFTSQLLKLLQSEASFNAEHRSLFSKVREAVNDVVQARQAEKFEQQVPDNVDATIGDFVFCPHPAIVRVCAELMGGIEAVLAHFDEHMDLLL